MKHCLVFWPCRPRARRREHATKLLSCDTYYVSELASHIAYDTAVLYLYRQLIDRSSATASAPSDSNSRCEPQHEIALFLFLGTGTNAAFQGGSDRTPYCKSSTEKPSPTIANQTNPNPHNIRSELEVHGF